ncbi:uncharacterized protein BDFB_004301 [Asbolus verrucosus]|uniref:Uncharacterized protein n=1 Tax=Asbolus verrucosus TaxID=1661398 RepID=A0A482VQ09_ASBVE|nr:uncharacterized protein BDFB_004301 [Asbolus verrucosus]
MDGVSVISLSSTSTRASPSGRSSESAASIVSVSSESQRVPVSWESNKKQKDTLLVFGDTLNHLQKVKEWMKSCKCGNEHHDSVDSNENSKSTCIRYDFDKSTRASSLPKSCFTRTRPLFSYMEEAKKRTNNNSRSTRAKSADYERLNGHRKNGNHDTPLSPESQKKELCNYLQLMKPGEKKEIFCTDHNRRSVRVRNQNQTEKGKLEDKLKDKDPQKVFADFEEYERIVEDVVNYPTLKSFEELNMKMNKVERYFQLKRKRIRDNKYLPLPATKIYEKVTDFEDSMQEIVEEAKKAKLHVNGCMEKIENRRKFKFSLKKSQKFKKSRFYGRRINSLRSKGHLRNISLDTLILRKSHLRKKAAQRRLRELKEKPPATDVTKKSDKIESPRCEIISVHTNSDDENVDLKNFVDDMLELDKMSEEHRKSVIESRILASSSIANLINKQTTPEEDVQRAYKIFSDLSNERKNSEEKENTQEDCLVQNLATDLIISEHDYAVIGDHREEEEESVGNSLSPVPMPDLEVLPVSTEIEMKSLQRSLALTSRRKLYSNNYGLHNWSASSKSDGKKLNHSISISKKNGAVLKAFYQDYNLVVTQQNLVSFWTQSALGNVLGAQNMWIPKGQAQRIPLNSTYVQKEAMEMVISTETSVAYVELWTKEHKSDVREVPVADVFATVYFWRLRQNGLDKKALQLENIKGFADDVQYCVLRCYPRIIVSWHSVQGGEKKTKIHSYHLAADFQTVANISEIQPVEHYVSSLHNIEGTQNRAMLARSTDENVILDCDNLVMGCGENKITLWNVEYGYVVATIELSNIKSPLSTLWVKCDRGFLFTIQECVDQELRLIAINGMNHSWKKLQNYNPLQGFDGLKGVCVENGILIAYYSQGILCWNAQTGELIVEEVPNECEYIPSGKHVIMIVNEKIIVRHSLSHLITADEF